jgi:alpha-N-acetylglucosamine transferase
MEITAGIKNEWVRVEKKRKARAARRGEFFGRVRSGVRHIFVFLFVATVLVFAYNQRVEIQSIASAKFHEALKKSYAPNGLRQNAFNYEKRVDDIAK